MLPHYKATDILDMQYDFVTYRGVWLSDDMDSSDFLYLSSRLQKDGQEKKLDPFFYKVAVPPQAIKQ